MVTNKAINHEIKHVDGLLDILKHYEDILYYIKANWGESILKTWNIDPSNKQDIRHIQREKEAVRYLVACKHEIAHKRHAKKPYIQDAKRCFQRHLAYLKKAHNCDEQSLEHHPYDFVKREFRTCKYYIEQFQDRNWYRSLPDKIETVDDKINNIQI